MNNCANATCTLNDQDRMEDLLSQEKFLIDGYATFIPEAACTDLWQVLSENLNGCFTDQYAIFDKMSQLGWYPVKSAPQADIDEAKQKSNSLKQQLG